jgi:hypothetical protein
MTTTKSKTTWIGDVRTACYAADVEFYGQLFNDRHLTCRRLKFYATVDSAVENNGGEVTDDQLAIMQNVIQARRPHLNVTVSRWETQGGWQGFGNVVVYYRPKTGRYLKH